MLDDEDMVVQASGRDEMGVEGRRWRAVVVDPWWAG